MTLCALFYFPNMSFEKYIKRCCFAIISNYFQIIHTNPLEVLFYSTTQPHISPTTTELFQPATMINNDGEGVNRGCSCEENCTCGDDCKCNNA
ncbi:hypothetical protein BX661DRAFT_178482 [Kickxella alabastrina]|uniref:uncharacterized protein n=1 Tax=Kickxella alabastrina TaxID=61397 RepID=UPI00221E92F7|nr:uncharacterized protein BX661DRAFT_190937 [Kickxella alabastrina]XP_051393876.1 uncharacterized protein BX661DRAFT_178482 [Kickxella alabastrina]KAI7818972.1 hypothetical protein BX661DRAFT_190937 [Kickxella alabastrina]KAI7833488.1 hypothetical protein BX661DRAFT_178482 [Kickxella alabastrina]